jgi:hypothetical protein
MANAAAPTPQANMGEPAVRLDARLKVTGEAVIGFAGPSVDRFQHPIDTHPANAERLGDRCGPDVGTNCGDEAWLLCGAVEKPTDNNLAVFRHSD